MITQSDLDNLADIVWWTRGYLAGCDSDSNSCPFGPQHIRSLNNARDILGDVMRGKYDSLHQNKQEG